MKSAEYYTNSEVSREYGVSNPTVATWVKDSIVGAKNLELIKSNDRLYIKRTVENIKLLKTYKERGSKHIPRSYKKPIHPKKNFLDSLSNIQKLEIIKDIEDSSLIDIKYSYFLDGSNEWDKRYKRTIKTSKKTLDAFTTKLIDILIHIPDGKKVNVIDIGSGNGEPVKNLLLQLKKHNAISSYTSLDISESIIEKTLKEINKLNLNVPLGKLLIDIERNSFEELTYNNIVEFNDSINLIFYSGGTLGSSKYIHKVLHNIENSLSTNDIFYMDSKRPSIINTQETSEFLDKDNLEFFLYATHALNIEADKDNVNFEYDSTNFLRKLNVELISDYSLTIPINNHDQTIDLTKGSRITILQHKLLSLQYILDCLNSKKVQLIHYSMSYDEKHMMLVFKK